MSVTGGPGPQERQKSTGYWPLDSMHCLSDVSQLLPVYLIDRPHFLLTRSLADCALPFLHTHKKKPDSVAQASDLISINTGSNGNDPAVRNLALHKVVRGQSLF